MLVIKKKVKIYVMCTACFVCLLFSGCSNKKYLEGIEGNTEGDREQTAEDRFADFDGFVASSGEGIYEKVTNFPQKCINIYYYDFNKNTNSIWCNKLQCSHNSEECVSYIPLESEYDSIFFHNGRLYKFMEDDEGIYLESFNSDGSGQKRFANMMPKDEKVLQFKQGKFYGEYFYYGILNEQKNLIIYRVGISSNTAVERLFEIESEDDKTVNLEKMYINDKYLYVISSVEIEEKKYKGTTYQFDLASKNYNIINKDKKNQSTTVCNDKMYFMENVGVLTVIDNDGNEREIELKGLSKESTRYTMYCSEKYIVFDNYYSTLHEKVHRIIYVYDILADTLKEYNIAAIEESVEKASEPFVLFGTDAESFNQMIMAMPQGIDGGGYYIHNPISGPGLIRFRLDSSLWNEMGEYSLVGAE